MSSIGQGKAKADERTGRPQSGFYPGVNLASAEFGEGTKLGTNFIYPSREEFAYYQGKGLNLIRIPFLWERVQPRLRGELDAANIAEIDRCIEQANRLDLVVVLDPHNYGGRRVDGKHLHIGIDRGLTSDDFNDFWGKLARRYRDKPLVWFGLMNEPNKQSADLNAEIMQSAVNAIRATVARTGSWCPARPGRVLIPGSYRETLARWSTSSIRRTILPLRCTSTWTRIIPGATARRSPMPEPRDSPPSPGGRSASLQGLPR